MAKAAERFFNHKVDDSGVMRADGLHLIAAGCDVWIEAIRPLLREIAGKPGR